MDRTEAARALAKIAAYIACGQPAKARPYAEALMAWWRKAGVL
jgi:hypothetical protein